VEYYYLLFSLQFFSCSPFPRSKRLVHHRDGWMSRLGNAPMLLFPKVSLVVLWGTIPKSAAANENKRMISLPHDLPPYTASPFFAFHIKVSRSGRGDRRNRSLWRCWPAFACQAGEHNAKEAAAATGGPLLHEVHHWSRICENIK
jgi:hypothetical protein